MRLLAALLMTTTLSACMQRIPEDPSRGSGPGVCRNYPEGAAADTARVALLLTIEADGTLSAVTIDSETPKGQGFGAAALQCIVGFRFKAGRDGDGKPVRMTKKVAIHFVRS